MLTIPDPPLRPLPIISVRLAAERLHGLEHRPPLRSVRPAQNPPGAPKSREKSLTTRSSRLDRPQPIAPNGSSAAYFQRGPETGVLQAAKARVLEIQSDYCASEAPRRCRCRDGAPRLRGGRMDGLTRGGPKTDRGIQRQLHILCYTLCIYLYYRCVCMCIIQNTIRLKSCSFPFKVAYVWI